MEDLAGQVLAVDVPDADDAKFGIRLDSFSSWRDLNNIPIPYMRSHQKFLSLLSAIITLVVIVQVVQLPLEMEAVPHSSSGLTRPGWARHFDDGYTIEA